MTLALTRLAAGLGVAISAVQLVAGGYAMMNDGQKSLFQRMRVVSRFARVNARAYVALFRIFLRERLWRVAPRSPRLSLVRAPAPGLNAGVNVGVNASEGSVR